MRLNMNRRKRKKKKKKPEDERETDTESNSNGGEKDGRKMVIAMPTFFEQAARLCISWPTGDPL